MRKSEIWNGEGVIEIDNKNYFRGEIIPIEGIEKDTLKQLRKEKKIIPEPEKKKEK